MALLWLSALLMLLSSAHLSDAEGTSFTVIMERSSVFWNFQDAIEKVLNRVSARFPHVMRQYTSVVLYEDGLKTNISSDKDVFMQVIRNSYSYWDWLYITNCNKFLLSGLKEALEVSPAETFMLVFTSGAIADAGNATLWSDILTLLDEKRPQIYFMLLPYICPIGAPEQKVFSNVSSLTYGEIISIPSYDLNAFINSLDILLYKPRSSTHLLSLNVNVTGKYSEAFSVHPSLSHLLIRTDGKTGLQVTDPNGKEVDFLKSPQFYRYYQSPHLLTNPSAGSWNITLSGEGYSDVKIMGFLRSETPGSCIESDCHLNATCEEFGGGQQCTCKEGFAGDGNYCADINECQNPSDNKCLYLGCLNTVGSYVCYCWYGHVYQEGLGCVDIDECADSSLNDCHAMATCTNMEGYYTCKCYDGYYGDGRHCEINECEQGTPCPITTECVKTTGSYSCVDPCTNHVEVNQPWRSTANRNSYEFYSWYSWMHCDYDLRGWKRFKTVYDQKLPEKCVPEFSCGTQVPMWLNGSHPTIEEGIVTRNACGTHDDNCCYLLTSISVKMCPGGYFTYKFGGASSCHFAFCNEPNYSCSTVECASDEECRTDNGVQGCYCKETIADPPQPGNLIEYIKPQVLCGLENVQISFSKCQLEQLGYDTTFIHLRDTNCQFIYEKRDRIYAVFTTPSVNGYCGASMTMNDTEVRYMNTVYIRENVDGVIVRNDYPIDFYCSYPLNMEISLLSAINSFTASAEFVIPGTTNYTVAMGLFQDSSYSIPYMGPEVWLPSTGKMYVGVIAGNWSGSSQFVLIMTNCYATPTPDRNSATRYDIIKNRCPNKSDPTISVQENGASLKGRFYLQVFKFLSRYPSVYLHCQVGLCNKGISSCSAGCSSARATDTEDFSVKNFTLGPIYQRDTPSTTAGQDLASSAKGRVAPLAEILIGLFTFLLTLF